MKKKAKKKSQFRKRRNVDLKTYGFCINDKDFEFVNFIAKASREGRL